VVIRNIKKGMGLIEVLIAVTVSVIALTAMVSMVVTALRSSLQSRMYLEATKIANTQIEKVRALRDSGSWSDFMVMSVACKSSNKCRMNINDLGYGPDQPTVPYLNSGIYYNFFVTDINGADIDSASASTTTSVRITAEASWDNGAKKTTMITDLSNWQAR
jgi:Tfp pilus assembly protein PilV